MRGLLFVPDANTQAANPLVQEQMSVETWGKQALAMGFAGRQKGDLYRVLAAYSNTVVTITTTNLAIVTNLAAGMFCETNLGGPVEFQANQPIQVAHFANGTGFDSLPGFEGDPCEILLPTTAHYLETNIVFILPNDNVTGDFYTNYLNIIAPQSAINSTYVDNSLVSVTNYVAIGASGYYGTQVAVTNGTHTVTSSQPVGVEAYGWGDSDAYGYFGGIVK